MLIGQYGYPSQARSHRVEWGGKCNKIFLPFCIPEQQDAIFLPPLRIFLQCFIVVLSL